jgi:hypothetical protein
MKMFIWPVLYNATYQYHDAGAVVVVAKDLDRALLLLPEKALHDADNTEALATPVEYDLAGDVEEKVFIFQDAGCC